MQGTLWPRPTSFSEFAHVSVAFRKYELSVQRDPANAHCTNMRVLCKLPDRATLLSTES